ncbi:MAG: hypothetical protein GEU75_11045 [Dehalococcoidia bacterium]|nr:hypothetical protein [Dehalococcoidia bacterium]
MGGRELIGIIGLVLILAGIVGFLIMYRRYSSGASPTRSPKVSLDPASLIPPSTRAERQETPSSSVTPARPPASPERPARPDLLARPETPGERPGVSLPRPDETPSRPSVSLPRPEDSPARPSASPPLPVAPGDPAMLPARPVLPSASPDPALPPRPRPLPGSVLSRYAAVGRKFTPSYPDPVTWGALRAVMDEAESFFARGVRMPNTEDAASVDEEIRRLIIDGYILGRVEQRTETASLRFGKASHDPDRDGGRFIELVVKAAKDGWQTGVFSGPIDPDIESVIGDFVQDAARGIAAAGADPADGNDDGVAVALSRACSAGRETALIEGTFLDPTTKRTVVQAIVASSPSALDRIGSELNYRSGDALKIAEKALRLTRDEFRRPNANLVRNERSV